MRNRASRITTTTTTTATRIASSTTTTATRITSTTTTSTATTATTATTKATTTTTTMTTATTTPTSTTTTAPTNTMATTTTATTTTHDEHGANEHHADGHHDHDGDEHHADGHDHGDVAEGQPDAITACLVGLHSRPLALRLQRFVNEYDGEPLMAIVPAATLQQLWDLVGVAETALISVAVLVIAAGLIGMTTTLLAGLAERRREMAVLRAVGAGRGWVFALLIVESAMLAATAAIVGTAAAYGAMFAGRAVLEDRFGLALAGGAPGLFDLAVVAGVTLAGVLAAAFPAWRAYRYSLADGLAMRV